MIYSCNEKISPELQTGNSTTIPSTTAPDEYYFRVVNNSATVLNYKLHRTGTGNATTECSIKSTITALSSTLYHGEAISATPHDLKAYDISCYMEAEELSLYFNGLDFGFEASKNTCEYVAYSPYSYFDVIPGSSATTYGGITCGDGVGDADVAAIATTYGFTYGAGNTPVGCNQMVDIGIGLVASRTVRDIPEENQTLCSFDYETNGGGGGKNCDIGTIGFSIRNVFDNDTVTAGIQPASTSVPTGNHKCGGSLAACVEGPIKQIDSELMRVSEILNTTAGTNFTQDYTLPKLIGVRGDLYDIVNYRKGLASQDLDFISYLPANDSDWGDPDYYKSFDPNLMEKFAANKSPDNVEIINAAAILAEATLPHGYTKTKLAADPFLGVGGARVNPFYTFYCLDRAYEIKARIRMVVRDWDRVFTSTTSSLELISDSYVSPASDRIQDLPNSEVEFPDDPGNFNLYNDKDDWDVLVWMQRSDPNGVGVYDSGDTLWTPWTAPPDPLIPVQSLGWWDPSIFPNQGPTE
jgi:hypothetical protein